MVVPAFPFQSWLAHLTLSLLGLCIAEKVMNMLQSLSNVVTALVNERLLGVGSHGRGGSMEAGLAPGEVGWRNFDQPQLLNLKV